MSEFLKVPWRLAAWCAAAENVARRGLAAAARTDAAVPRSRRGQRTASRYLVKCGQTYSAWADGCVVPTDTEGVRGLVLRRRDAERGGAPERM